MPIFPQYLECPIYFPMKKGYSLENETPFRGIDAKHIVHDIGLLDEGINNLEVFLNVDLSGAITVDAVTTAALASNTYSNGSSGVGATITITANGVFPTIDGQAAKLGMKYLIKNEPGTNRLKNGVYSLTTLGTSGTQAVLTRTSDSDTSAEFDNQVVFATYPKTGTTNGGKYFVQTTTSPTVGTSNIIYITRSGGGTQNIEQTLIIGDDANGQDLNNVANFNCSTGGYTNLFQVSDTSIPGKPSGTNVYLGDTGSSVYMGEATANGAAGFSADWQGLTSINDGSYTIGRTGGGLGTYILLADGTQGGTIDIRTGINSGSISLAAVGTAGNINFTSTTITVNSNPTYTGTVAGAAALSVVNGLIMQ